jgi:molybdopterin/thiamine biosynthesis adenylyltransferase
MPLSLSDEEIQRYRRQLSMPEIGTRGQQHLKQATILIAGLGGLGSISAYYMAAAGVGQLKIADSDQVASHNLNRQILHTTVDIGKFKTVSACEKLKALNPWCHIDPLAERISDDTVGVMVSGCDLILDGTDNIGTRRVLNRAAQEAGIPFIFGGVNGFDGMLTTFIPGQSACLECIFPGNSHRSPEVTGVIGPAVGVIASLQSVEAVKILTGNGADLSGTLVRFHGLGMRMEKTIVDPDPDCRVCASG